MAIIWLEQKIQSAAQHNPFPNFQFLQEAAVLFLLRWCMKNPIWVFLRNMSLKYSIFLPAVGENTLLMCPIYCICYNPPVTRDAGSCYVTLQHFPAAFDFTPSPHPPTMRTSHPFIPSALLSTSVTLCPSRLFSFSGSLAHAQCFPTLLSLSIPQPLPFLHASLQPQICHGSTLPWLLSAVSPLPVLFSQHLLHLPSL